VLWTGKIQPAEPATPLAEVYQPLLAGLVRDGRKPSTIHRYRYNIVRLEKWLIADGKPATRLPSSSGSGLVTPRTALG
jgi:hypothetical protein